MSDILTLSRFHFQRIARTSYNSYNLCQVNYSTNSSVDVDENQSDTKTILTAKLHENIEKSLENEEFKYRSHPGRRRQPSFKLPALHQLACKRAISKYLTNEFRESVERHRKGFSLIQLPDELEDIKEREKVVWSKVNSFIPLRDEVTDPDEIELIKKKREKKFSREMLLRKSNWQQIVYDEEKAARYLASRFVPNYAALKWVFSDLCKSDPNFVPKTLFDFGSGIGTTMHAANDTWPHKINEHMNVELSKPMIEISDFVLRGGFENKPQLYPGVYFREYLPVSSQVKYDLVVSAFTLLELPSRKARIHAIEALWNKTADTMIVIEAGSRYGFTTVLEARNFVLQDAGYDVNKSFYKYDPDATKIEPLDPYKLPNAYIQGPCPHHYACPRLFTGGPILCNFGFSYFPLEIGKRGDCVSINDNFSYIILRKGKKTFEGPSNWPRVVQPVKHNSGFNICRLCCPDGSVKSITLTKKKHKGHLYHLTKQSSWGDLLPVTVLEEEKQLHKWDFIKRQKRLESNENDDENN